MKGKTKMKKEKYYFYYSQKQMAEIFRWTYYHKEREELNKCLVNGLFGTKLFAKVRYYTECTKQKKPSGLWDDYKYVGEGWIYEVNGIKQF